MAPYRDAPPPATRCAPSFGRLRPRRTRGRGAPLTLLDAQAVVAALTGEPAAAEVEPLLRDTVDRPRISAVNLAEVLDVLVRLQAWAVDDVTEKIDWLQAGGLEVVAADPDIGLQAGKLHARLYDWSKCPLSMADCLALATAQALDQSLATSDPALAMAARGEGVRIAPLPDRRGVRP